MPSTHRKTRGVSLTYSVSNGTTTYNYIYNGDKLTEMTKGSTKLTFTYDAAGTPLTVTYNGTRYYYKTNLQGDVTDILNSSGTAVVSYVYDAYGRIRSKSGSLVDTLGFDNPLRYRGYVYDVQTEFYYLQSRYYYPTWGRFINADEFPSTGQGFTGNNMFAYCGNNPVNRIDPAGEAWLHWIIGAAVVVGLGVLTVATCGGSLALAATSVGLIANGIAAASTATAGSALFNAAGAYLCTKNTTTFQTTNAAYNFDGAKGSNYVNKRGWSGDMINYAISNGKQGSSVNMANDAACTVYAYPGVDNQYVVIENFSRSVVQVSNFYDAGWIPDSRIVWDP